MKRDRALLETVRRELVMLCGVDKVLEPLKTDLESGKNEDPVVAVKQWARSIPISHVESLASASVGRRELGPVLLECWEAARVRRAEVRPASPPTRLLSWSFDIPEEEFFYSVGQELQEALTVDDILALIEIGLGCVDREVTAADIVFWWAGGRTGCASERLRTVLLSWFESENVELRRAAGWALSWTGAPTLEAQVDRRIRNESDPELRASLLLLTATHSGVWVEEYEECMNSESSVLRAATLVASEVLRPERALTLATALTASDPPWLVRLAEDIRRRVLQRRRTVHESED